VNCRLYCAITAPDGSVIAARKRPRRRKRTSFVVSPVSCAADRWTRATPPPVGAAVVGERGPVVVFDEVFATHVIPRSAVAKASADWRRRP
jgi:hypothetical protein